MARRGRENVDVERRRTRTRVSRVMKGEEFVMWGQEIGSRG